MLDGPLSTLGTAVYTAGLVERGTDFRIYFNTLHPMVRSAVLQGGSAVADASAVAVPLWCSRCSTPWVQLRCNCATAQLRIAAAATTDTMA